MLFFLSQSIAFGAVIMSNDSTEIKNTFDRVQSIDFRESDEKELVHITKLSPDALNAILVAASWVPGCDANVMKGMDMGTVACTRLLLCGNRQLTSLLQRSLQTWRFVLDKNNVVQTGSKRRKKNTPVEFKFGGCDWQKIDPRFDQFKALHTIEFFIHESAPGLTATSPSKQLRGLVSRLIITAMQNPPKMLQVFRIVLATGVLKFRYSHILPTAFDVLLFAESLPNLKVLDVNVRRVDQGFETCQFLQKSSLQACRATSLQIRECEPKAHTIGSIAPPLMPDIVTLSASFAIDPTYFQNCKYLTTLIMQRAKLADHILEFLPNLIKLAVDSLSPKAYYQLLPRPLKSLVCGSIGYFGRSGRGRISGLPDEEPSFPPHLETLELPDAAWLPESSPCIFPTTLTSLIVSEYMLQTLCLDSASAPATPRFWHHGMEQPVMRTRLNGPFHINLWFDPPQDYPHLRYLTFEHLVTCRLNLCRIIHLDKLSFVESKSLERLQLGIDFCQQWYLDVNKILPDSIVSFVMHSYGYPPRKISINPNKFLALRLFDIASRSFTANFTATKIKVIPPTSVATTRLEFVMMGRRVSHIKINNTTPKDQTGHYIMRYRVVSKTEERLAERAGVEIVTIAQKLSPYVGQFEFEPVSKKAISQYKPAERHYPL